MNGSPRNQRQWKRKMGTYFLLFFFVSSLGAVFFSVPVAEQAAHAQEEEVSGPGDGFADPNDQNFITPPGGVGEPGSMFDFSVRRAVKAINPLPSLTEILAGIGNAIMSLAGLILWVAGLVLNAAVFHGVLQMGTLVDGIEAVNKTWETLRDLANIFFIFGLIAIGIATILEVQSYGIKSLLARLIVAALLINFSLFFTQVIVDASNILAAGIYQKIELAECRKETGNLLSIDCGDGGLSETIMDSLRLTTIYSTGGSPDVKPLEAGGGGKSLLNDPLDVFIATIMGTIFILIAAFVLFAMAILLIIRLVVLILLMILSPLAFLAMAVPGLQGQARGWWKALLNQALFAPALFLLLFVTVAVMRDSSFLQVGDFANALSGIQGSIGVFVNYLIIIVLIIASLVIAKQMGAVGAGKAVDIGKKWGIWGAKQAFWQRTTRPMWEGLKHQFQEHVTGPLERKEEGVVAKTIDKIPFARSGLQAVNADRRTDVAKRQEELANLRTGELVRRLKGGVLPNTRAAILQEVAKREDLDELSVAQARRGRGQLVKAGMSTLNIDKFRPDIQPDEESIMKQMVKQRKPSDVANLHPVVVSGPNKDQVGRSMVKTYDGGMMAAAARRGDAIAKTYMDELFKFTDERLGFAEGTTQKERSSEKIAQALTQLAQEHTNEATRPGRSKGEVAFYQRLAERNHAAAADIIKAPARRLMNLDPWRRRRDEGGADDDESTSE